MQHAQATLELFHFRNVVYFLICDDLKQPFRLKKINIFLRKLLFFSGFLKISSVKFRLYGPQMFPLSLFRQLVGY